MINRLYYGDNLDAPREHVASESVDLVYLDPPFNLNANILFKSPTGAQAEKSGRRHLAAIMDFRCWVYR